MGNQAGIIIRNVKNELFHSAKRLILNEVKGIECLRIKREASFKIGEYKNIVTLGCLKDEFMPLYEEYLNDFNK